MDFGSMTWFFRVIERGVPSIIKESILPVLYFNGLNGDKLFIDNNIITDSLRHADEDFFIEADHPYWSLHVDNAKINVLTFFFNRIAYNKTLLNIDNSNLKESLSISDNKFGKETSTEFYSDTIAADIYFIRNSGAYQRIKFENCFINSRIAIEKQSPLRYNFLEVCQLFIWIESGYGESGDRYYLLSEMCKHSAPRALFDR